MKIIESDNELTQLIKENIELVIPIWSSRRGHEHMFPISFVYFRNDSAEEFIVNLNHIDANKVQNFDIHQYVNENTLVFGNRYLNTIGLDYEYVYFEHNGTPFQLREQTEGLYRTYRSDYTLINDCVALMRWADVLGQIKSIPERKNWYKKYSNSISQLGRLEGAGVKVDVENFIDTFKLSPEYISDDGRVYTQYNPYTITGRPSNHHLNVNWAALNKRDGTRKSIISRFGDNGGTLLQFDFESYHLRLIAKLAKYDLPLEMNVHDYLAEQYGGVDREVGKALTFRYLYGGLDDLARTIPFFVKVDEWLQSLWLDFTITGQLITPIFKREIPYTAIENPTSQKVFNYLLQALETEVNYLKIQKVLDALDTYKSEFVLYTYDAFLIDTHPDERDDILKLVPALMSKGGFPVRSYEGKNYDDLIVLN